MRARGGPPVYGAGRSQNTSGRERALAPAAAGTPTPAPAPAGRTSAPAPAASEPAPTYPAQRPPPPLQAPDPNTNLTYQRGLMIAIHRMRPPPPISGPSNPRPNPTPSTSPSQPTDQALLRRWLALAPSFLMHDLALAPSPDSGALGWAEGVHPLVGVMQALHERGELEWETMDEASRALSDCWSAAICWVGMDRAKGAIQVAGRRLGALMDRGDKTRYKGKRVYPTTD